MNKPLLIAVVCTALPACAAQDPAGAPSSARVAAQSAVPTPAHCAMGEHPPPASGALPARAGTGPEPQRGTVAPNMRVPSQVMTPSMRAMEQAMAGQDGRMAQMPQGAQCHCAMMQTAAACEKMPQKK